MTQHRYQHRVIRHGIGTIAWMAFAVVAFVLCASANGQHPKRHDQFKHQVEKLEEVWRTAELNGDADAMAKLLSDDFVGISMTGQVVTKTQQLDRMRSQKMVLTRIDLTDMKVKLIGSTAIVTSLAEVEGTNDGVPIHGVFRYTRVYARQFSGMWKITNYEATRVGPPPPPGEKRHPSNEDAKPE
jgi:ketosteroid isomerase-like protein